MKHTLNILTALLLTSLYLQRVPVHAQSNSPSSELRTEVLMGMRIESIAQDGGETHVLTTGSEFVLGKGGRVRCFQRIPERREVAGVT